MGMAYYAGDDLSSRSRSAVGGHSTRLDRRSTLVAALLVVCAGSAFAEENVLVYTRQPTSEPPYKQIHRMNADGTGDTTLTSLANGFNYADWSPDGSKIAACRYVSATVWSIYSMNADGSGLARLTSTPSAFDTEPDWSPDGYAIIFTRLNTSYGDEQLWLMNSDGSDLHSLGVAGSAPCWSPDSRRIAYQSIRSGFYGIYLCDAGGTNETPLLTSGSHEMLPVWAPDGEEIAFVSWRDGNPEIYVMNADGSGQTRLTNNTAGDFDPAWSPDGSLIAFDSDVSGPLDHWEIHVMGADGSNQRRLTYMPPSATAINPDWKPQTLVATLLQSMSAAYRGECIEVTWTLSAIDEGVQFDILRAVYPGNEFVPVPATLARNNLAFTFRDASIQPEAAYRYRVLYHDGETVRMLFETEAIAVTAMPFALRQNSPNPSNPSTRIEFDLPARCVATLEIYDVRGTAIRTLVRKELDGGTHRAWWDGLDSEGQPASSGVYFYRLTAGTRSISRKLVLLR
jgi:hypothetical protein